MARSRRLYSLDSLVMYFVTLVGEVPVILLRLFAVSVILGLLSVVKGHGESTLWAYLPFVPTFWSVLALATPIGGGWWWRQRLGGRQPSGREQLAYHDAIELLQANSPVALPLPTGWFVLDVPEPDAAVCGETLMLSRGLLESEHLPAVIAHELGHLATPDGRLTAAINRLLLWMPSQEPHEEPLPMLAGLIRWAIRTAIKPFKGGLGLYATSPIWGRYWRTREYKADQYAAHLGQADELADFLEVHALIHDHPIPHIWLTEHTHPPTELRADRLRNTAAGGGLVAPGSEPVKAAPAGPPTAGPDGPALTEPDPSAERTPRSAGRTLPTSQQQPRMES